jgi:uncharacterized protein
MLIYFESSALVKRYAPNEPNAAQIAAFFTITRQVFTNAITSVEVRSAFRMKERSGEFTPAQVQAGLLSFNGHITQQNNPYHLIQLTPNILAIANRLVLGHKLRAYDAIQIATALELALLTNLKPSDVEFHTADKDQAAAAQAEGLTVVLY